MKKNIKEGRFLPNITNSWAKSRCEIQFYRNNDLIQIKTRSTWDAYFQIFNTDLIYESLIIQYKFNRIEHNYIVDFVDYNNKIIYEIKPSSNISDRKNQAKIRYAKKWCKSNGYTFVLIKDSWFKKNYDEKIVIGQPCEEKMKRNIIDNFGEQKWEVIISKLMDPEKLPKTHAHFIPNFLNLAFGN